MKAVKCKSGLIGSQERIRKRYTSLEDLEGWCNLYDIHGRLGFSTPEDLWMANPTVRSSIEPSDLEAVYTTMEKLIPYASGKYGAPMGRRNTRPDKYKIVDIGAAHKYVVIDDKSFTLFDRAVSMPDGCYDAGGVYWGHGKQLRVQYTKNLKYIVFYRVGDEPTK